LIETKGKSKQREAVPVLLLRQPLSVFVNNNKEKREIKDSREKDFDVAHLHFPGISH
jgi:hypothetical protein